MAQKKAKLASLVIEGGFFFTVVVCLFMSVKATTFSFSVGEVVLSDSLLNSPVAEFVALFGGT